MKQIINASLAKLGYQISAVRPRSSPLDAFLNRLKQLRYSPSYIVDVGANHGGWTRKFLRAFPETDVLMVEPQEDLKTYAVDLLARPNVKWMTAGAGAANATMKFTLAATDDSCSFRVSPAEAARAGLRQIDVPVFTLDHIVSTNGTRTPDMVKIDAEGLDLDVIAGAKSLIGKTEFFLVEAALFAKDMPNTVARVVDHMDSLGYKLFDFTGLNYSPA